jgi:hypothetical protein
MGAEGVPPAGWMCVLGSAAVLETQRDLEGLEGPSRITSSAKRARFAVKCCINGISVRTLMRGRFAAIGAGASASARSVDAIRIERLRPSGSSITT